MKRPDRLRLKALVLATLALAPVLFLFGVGVYHLWLTDWSFVAYWPMIACWLVAYLLGWYWTKRAAPKPIREGFTADGEPIPHYWTDRDREAWALVEQHVAAVTTVTADQFGDLNRYATDAEALALKVSRVYRPNAADPFGHLTVPEILACGELVAHDLTKIVDAYVPGSHLLTVNDWKRLRTAVDTAADWYPRLRNAYWLASAVFDPIKTGLQVAAVKAGLVPAFEGFQQNLMLWFHTAYVKELGRYLIELNSGRLRVGAKRYLELMALHQVPDPATASGGRQPPGATAGMKEPEPSADPASSAGSHRGADAPRSPGLPVTVAVVGPVKAGKSSLVNALLGEQRAATDVLPLTAGITRYTLQQPGLPTFTLLDTQGFGRDGPTQADVQAAVQAAREADVMLLTVPARSAARKPEADFLDRVRAGVAAVPNLKMPPVLLVLTHVDLLSPAAEWSPPYDWQDGTRLKEEQMREAAAAAGEVFAGKVADVIPVCAAAGKEMGVRDDLLAAVAARLGEARGVGLLRALHAEASADRVKKLGRQVVNAGGQLLKAWLATRK